MRSGVTNHPEASVLQHLTDVTRKGGVINPSTDFVVSEHGAGGLFVDVSSGHAIIKGITAYPVRSTATEAVAITANSSGSPRISTIVLYIDTSATPGSTDEANDVAVLASVNGTPASSPVALSDADIQTVIGANNPFIRLADVEVASGATGISNSNITNSEMRVFLHSPSPKYPITYAATVTPNFNNSNKQYVVLTGDITVNAPTNMEQGEFLQLEFVQDGTGGRAITWFSTITWLSPDTTMNTDANKKTVYAIEKTGDATFNGYLVGKEY
jgi:hypothetical protein